ncbi:MAG: group II intron reverse transcriptase/maturase [Smithellaceae bacterium]
MNRAKPFCISKWEVWEAYKLVKANKGAAGVDGQSIAEFEEDLKDNLFKIWNRMSSGSYFPPPVRRVDIPKDNGKTRPLGIPTVADRIAQTVVKRYLEPILEENFHPDSYGYRSEKSAIEAVGVARQRCWRYDWVLDLDIKGFFDNIDHDLLMRAVRKHTDCKWVLLYIERWLKAPAQLADGSLINRDKGTPQGGVVSPLLANLFLHYAFDLWMKRQYPQIPFERYADDGICHCRSKAEAERLRVAIEKRFAECGLELNLQKTKIVYCKDNNRRGNYPEQKFDFLGFTFRPRRAKERSGKFFVSFIPAISNKAKKSICDTMRQWNLHRKTDKSLDDLARVVNPVLRGWINYYGSFYKSALYHTFKHLNNILVRWATRKYKRMRGHKGRAGIWLQCIVHRQPRLFTHWQLSQMKAGQ